MLDILSTLAAEGTQSMDLQIHAGKIIAQLGAFSIVAFILNKFAFGPLLKVMEERQKQIDDGLKYADQMKERLADAENQHEARLREASEQASKIVAEARSNAKQFLDKEMQQATGRAQEIVAKAEKAMEQERTQMLSEVRQEVAQLVVQTSAAVLARDLSDDERSKFSESAASELALRN